MQLNNSEVVSNILRALLFLTSAYDNVISYITEEVPITLLVEHVRRSDRNCGMLALRALGNVCASSGTTHEELFGNEFLLVVVKLLETTSDPTVLKEVCWVVSNLAACPEPNLQKLIDCGITKHMCHIILASAIYNV